MIVSNKNIEISDGCPKDCKLINDLSCFGQNSLCCRCPVFNCYGEDVLCAPEEYRSDWAEEWKRFFDGEIEEPELWLEFKNNE